jgi:heme-degrading monooxygenase HmoA
MPATLASKYVGLTPWRVHEPFRPHFERHCAKFAEALIGADADAYLLLRRRNDVTMYGKLFSEYGERTPDYASLRLYSDATLAYDTDADALPGAVPLLPLCSPGPLLWDATLVERPLARAALEPGSPCFLAMNRFPVKPDCAAVFEERWASRTSRLPQQPGLLGFSLLRRSGALGASEEPYTYSTATLWASEAAWRAWCEGEGKEAHAASRTAAAKPTSVPRTPVTEWMDGSASPIFWDVPVYVHPKQGIAHAAAASAVDAGAPPSSAGVAAVELPLLAGAAAEGEWERQKDSAWEVRRQPCPSPYRRAHPRSARHHRRRSGCDLRACISRRVLCI